MSSRGLPGQDGTGSLGAWARSVAPTLQPGEAGSLGKRAERLYRSILPLITFLMSSIENFLCYGKRLTARRLGFPEVHARMPSQQPTPFGMEMLARLSKELGPL